MTQRQQGKEGNRSCKELSYQRDRLCSILSDAGKFCLAHGLRQLTPNVKHDIRTLDITSDLTFAPRKAPNDACIRLLWDVKC